MARAPLGATRRRTTAPLDPTGDPRVGELPDDDIGNEPTPDPVESYVTDAVRAQAEREVERLQALHSEVRTPDGRLRRARFIGSVLGLRFENYSTVQIAAILKVKRSSVIKALQMVRKDAAIADQLKRMDDQVVPIAIDNLHTAVINGDMRASMKLLDGRGLFRTHKSIDAQITEQRIDIRIVVSRPAHMDPNAPLPEVKPGSIAAGQPNGLKLPVIDVGKVG